MDEEAASFHSARILFTSKDHNTNHAETIFVGGKDMVSKFVEVM